MLDYLHLRWRNKFDTHILNIIFFDNPLHADVHHKTEARICSQDFPCQFEQSSEFSLKMWCWDFNIVGFEKQTQQHQKTNWFEELNHTAQ